MDMSRLVCTDFPFVNIPLFWFCALCASLDNCQNNGCFYLGENMQYLYIIKCNEFHKIGIANDVEARLAQLSTGNPYQLTVEAIYAFDNAEVVERSIHQKYKKSRQRGEWFSLEINDLRDIDTICKMLGASAYEYDGEDPTQEVIEQAEHDYILTGGVDWRLEARVDRNIPGYAIVKRGKNRSYLGYIRSTDLKDGLRPTVEEVENFLNSQGREHD